jgi:ferrous iron transport protein B
VSIRNVLGDDPEILLADERYNVISDIVEKSLKRGRRRWTTSDMLDKVFLDKWLGLPIFLSFMWILFALSAETAGVYMTIVEEFFGWLGGLFAGVGGELVSSLIVDGLIGGLGGVLVFVPPIFTTFLGISLLEDSGYLARAAFVMDRLMVKLGLHGRSFIPMLLGFGCTVPAIMACRSIEGEKDKMITMLVAPFMSCGARLPVYVVIAGAFWTGAGTGNIIWSIYLIGMILAVLVAYLFRQTMFKGEPSPFIMELPSYKIPTARMSILHMWERGRGFLVKAGTLLFVAAVAIWFLVSFPYGAEIEQSYAGMIGHAVEPLLRPLGFDWRIGVSLIFGLLAKEVLVEAIGIIYAVEGEEAIAAVFASSFTAVQGYALMLFTLIYTPCVAVLAAIKGETGEWKWVIFSTVYSIVLAYLISWLAVIIGGSIY